MTNRLYLSEVGMGGVWRDDDYGDRVRAEIALTGKDSRDEWRDDETLLLSLSVDQLEELHAVIGGALAAAKAIDR